MKLYPKKDPNAIDLLLNYTIFPDIKIYHSITNHFYGDEN
jgi:hypothetical protein